MNSKEAFEEIIKVCNYYHRQISNFDCETVCGYPIKNIAKDLEVLDILRKYIYFDKKDNYIKMFDIAECVTNFDFEILMDWLEK